jgi:hypothetical protein
MKKIIFPVVVLFAVLSITSCGEKVCLKCTYKYLDQNLEETLCSSNADERRDWQTNWIQKGYNCTVE